MDTTTIKNAIQAGELAPKHTNTGFTSLQVSITLESRLGLANMSKDSGISQQEIIRQALEGFLASGTPVRNYRTDRVDLVAKAEKEAAKAERIAARKAAAIVRAQALAEKAAAAVAKAEAKASEASKKAAALVA